MARGPIGILFPVAAALLLAAIAWPVACLLLAIPPTQAATVFFQEAGPALRVSVEASLCATLAATVLGVPAGYWLARSAGRFRTPAIFLLALPLAFPPVASGLMLLYAFGRNSLAGGWLSGHGMPVPDTLLGVGVAEFPSRDRWSRWRRRRRSLPLTGSMKTRRVPWEPASGGSSLESPCRLRRATLRRVSRSPGCGRSASTARPAS